MHNMLNESASELTTSISANSKLLHSGDLNSVSLFIALFGNSHFNITGCMSPL